MGVVMICRPQLATAKPRHGAQKDWLFVVKSQFAGYSTTDLLWEWEGGRV